MQLKDYFQEQKNSHMSDTDKLNLYQDFMVKNMKRHYSRKRSFLHVKSFAYSIIVMFFLFSLYGVYFFTDRYSEYDGLIMNSDNTVQASYIAKVIDFNGRYYIEHEGKRVETSAIQNGDVITLKENTQLICQINVGTKAKLIGPAQFSVEQVSKGKTPQYKLNIIQGDFVEMKSETKPSEQIQLTINNTLTVQQANGKAINYQLIKAGDNHIVKNNGGALSVTTVDQNNKQIKTNLDSAQVLAIGTNDIKLFDNMKKFADAMKTNNVSQIFTFNAPQEPTNTVTSETGVEIIETVPVPQEMSLTSLLSTSEETVDQTISNELSSLFSDSKAVISEDQYAAIPSTTYIQLLVDDVNKNMSKGQEKELSIAYVTLEKVISKLHEAFGLSYKKPSGATVQENILSLKSSITSVIKSIQTSYTLPEKYLNNLTTFADKLGDIAKQTFGGDVESTVEK